MDDETWEAILLQLHQFGFQLVATDRASGTITVRIPPLSQES